MFYFDDKGWLQAETGAPVKVFHFQTAKGKARNLVAGKSPIEYTVTHVTAFVRPKLDLVKLNYLLKNCRLSPEERVVLNEEMKGEKYVPGGLSASLGNEADAERDASWDFLLHQEGRDSSARVVITQSNLNLGGFYTWHGGLSKKYYATRQAGKIVYNRDKVLVWDGQKQVFPPGGALNAKSIGIENAFWAGPLKKVEDLILYPFGTKTIDVTDKLQGDVIQAEGFYFERAPSLHMDVLAQLLALLGRRFTIPVENHLGHYHVDPINRPFDPTYTLPIAELRELVRRT